MREFSRQTGAAAHYFRVVGLASSVLLDSAVPDSPVNRRISIVVMNKRTEAAISQENGNLLSVQNQNGTSIDLMNPNPEPVAQSVPEAAGETAHN